MDIQIDNSLLQELEARKKADQQPSAPPPDQTIGAPEVQIDPDLEKQLQARKKPEGVLDTVGSWISGAAKSVKESFTGPENLKYKGAPDILTALGKELPRLPLNPFSKEYDEYPGSDTLKTISRINRMKPFAQSDKAYAGIVRKALGDRFIRMEDDNGYPVVIYRGKDGSEKAAYVNKPGLDDQDIDREIHRAIPYLIGGGALGRFLVGPQSGALVGALGWGIAEGTTSLTMDAIAKAAGSDESLMTMLKRSGLAAAGGAAGDAAGRALSAVGAWLKANKYVDGGRLSESGVKRVKELGLDPDEIQKAIDDGLINPDEMARDMARPQIYGEAQTDEFGRVTGSEVGPHALRRKYEAKTAGVDLTTGEATRNADVIALEDAYAAGEMGDKARDIMRARIGRPGDEMVASRRMQEGAEKTLYKDTGAVEATPVEAGGSIQSTVRSKYAEEMAPLNEALNNIRRYNPDREQLRGLGKYLNDAFEKEQAVRDAVSELQSASGTDIGMSNSAKAVDLLVRYVKGEEKAPVSPLLGGKDMKAAKSVAPVKSVTEVRRALMRIRDAAKPTLEKNTKADYRGVAKIIDAFDNWVMDTADRYDAQELRDYMENMLNRAIVKSKYFGGKNDEGGRWVKKIIESGELNPTNVIADLKGNNRYAVQRVRALKRAIGESSTEMKMLKGLMLSDIFQTPKGSMRPIDKIMDELKSLQRNKAVYKELFNERERKAIANFMMKTKALKRLDRSEYDRRIRESAVAALAALRDMLSYGLRRKGTHETFQARTVRGSLYHMLARAVSHTPAVGMPGRAWQAGWAKDYARGVLPHDVPRDPFMPYAGAQKAQEYLDEENR